jgi:hypothetical protein
MIQNCSPNVLLLVKISYTFLSGEREKLSKGWEMLSLKEGKKEDRVGKRKKGKQHFPNVMVKF